VTAIATVYAVFADTEEAERIGRMMIEQELAACINILAPCRSIYRWQGAVETAEEVPALFKTRADQVDALIAAIARLHSYDVPAIAAWPIVQAGPGYAEWVCSGQAPGLR
jgi:periplasmic divalent cation tolerance protein